MKKTLMLLQPGYLPWLGFFEQVYRSDIFVIYDDTQYTKADWRNRNRIKAMNGEPAILTVPVAKAPTATLIRDIRIAPDRAWAQKHINILKACYHAAPFLNDYLEPISRIILKKHTHLIDLDVELIHLFLNILGLSRDLRFSSTLQTDAGGMDRMLAACRELGATHCYNGAAGRALYDPDHFRRQGVILEFQEFHCPVYPQLHGPFVPNLSLVDLLFNCGHQSLDVIIKGGAAQSEEMI